MVFPGDIETASVWSPGFNFGVCLMLQNPSIVMLTVVFGPLR